MKRQTKLFEFTNDQEGSVPVKRNRSASSTASPEIQDPQATPLDAVLDPESSMYSSDDEAAHDVDPSCNLESNQSKAQCSGSSHSSTSSSSDSGGHLHLNSSSGSTVSTDSDSSHLFQPRLRHPHVPVIPSDIARSRDDKPAQPQLRSFQKTRVGDRNRSFAFHWYQSYPFIEYSTQRDAVYCFSCRLFPSSSGYADTTFTTDGCNKWKKIGDKLKRHAESEAHKDSMTKWMAYKQTKSSTTVADQLTNQRASTTASNRAYISTLSQVAVLCVRQGIPLRGHDESSASNNKGNYVEILKLLASVMPELGRQFRLLPNNAKYTSKVVQNDLLKAAADVVLKQITDEIKDAEGFAVIADEARDISKKRATFSVPQVREQGLASERALRGIFRPM